MAVKSIRDGALFVIEDFADMAISAHKRGCNLYQNGVWYKFVIALSGGTYYLRRQTGSNLLDFSSMAGANVLTIGAHPCGGPNVLRVSDNLWYCVFHQDAADGSAYDVYITSSTDQGATWAAPAKIIDNGATWATTSLMFPFLIHDTTGNYYYCYVVGNQDKLGAYRCATANDPAVSGNWSAVSGSPFYDCPGGQLDVTGVYSGGKVHLIATMGDDGSARNYLWYLSGALGGAVTRHYVVGTWDYGVGSALVTVTQLLFNPQDNLWYVSAFDEDDETQRMWVTGRLGSKLWRAPCSAPAYWPSGAGEGVLFPDAGLSWDQTNDVRVMLNRGAIHSLRSGNRAGVTLSVGFTAYDDLADFLDRLSADTAQDLNEVGLPAFAFFTKDADGTWADYMIFPECSWSLAYGEGDDGNKITLTLTSPLPGPLIGGVNTGAMPSDLAAPGGETAEDGPYTNEG